MDKKQLITIILGTIVVTTLGYYFLQHRDLLRTRVQAVGSLIFTFNGLAPEAPVFDEPDVKPGDCYTREVGVVNEGANEVKVAVKATGINDPDNLADIFTILIKEGVTVLYGETTVRQFFEDSVNLVDGIPLSTVPAGGNTTYTFTVCMPADAGNEYQDKNMVFDLVFGLTNEPTVTPTPTPVPVPTPTPTPPDIPVPDECKRLEGKIDRVYYGTDASEFIHGSIYNDLIWGYGGDDHIDGSGGDDCIMGGPGNNYLEGEDGNDVLVSEDGNDLLKAGSGDDLVIAGGGDDEIVAGTGTDEVYAGDGNDIINAGDGNDIIYCGPGNDYVRGKSGEDTIYGNEGEDEILGGSSNDTLYGNEGNDEIKGGSGDDFLDGGEGHDSLNGNSGEDVCLNGEILAYCE